MIEYNLNLTQE